MRHIEWRDDVHTVVAELRTLAPPAAEVQAAVRAILADVRAQGDDAVRAHTRRLDGVALPERYRVPEGELRERLAALAPPVREALDVAAANIRAYHEQRGAALLAPGAAPGADRGPGGRAAGGGRPVRARRPGRLPVLGAHDRHPGAGGRRGTHRGVLAAPPAGRRRGRCGRRLRAAGRHRRVPHRRRPGRGRHGVRHAAGAALRRHRRARQRLRHRGQAPGHGRGAPSTAWPDPARCSWWRTRPPTRSGWPPTCWPRPSTARGPWRALPTSAAPRPGPPARR